MKNTLTLLALVISVTGIFVSVAREELRCYIGLGATNCQSNDTTEEENPSTPQEVIQRAREVIQPFPEANTETTADTPVKETEETETSNTPDTEKPPEITTPVEEPQETAASNTPSAIEEISQPQSQPIEVIPPPEETSDTQSQTLEIIPPPEN